jgi:hypothetical protein
LVCVAHFLEPRGRFVDVVGIFIRMPTQRGPDAREGTKREEKPGQ